MVDRFVRVPKRYLYAPFVRTLKLAPNTVTWAGLVLGLACAACAAAAQ